MCVCVCYPRVLHVYVVCVLCMCMCICVFKHVYKPKMASLNAFIFSSCNSVKQREKLVEILQTKDAGALLRVVKILETQECGYEDLAKDFFADLDKMQTDKYKQAVRLTIDQPQTGRWQ